MGNEARQVQLAYDVILELCVCSRAGAMGVSESARVEIGKRRDPRPKGGERQGEQRGRRQWHGWHQMISSDGTA